MDKASDFGSEDWGFESLRGRFLFRHKTKINPQHSEIFLDFFRAESHSNLFRFFYACLENGEVSDAEHHQNHTFREISRSFHKLRYTSLQKLYFDFFKMLSIFYEAFPFM